MIIMDEFFLYCVKDLISGRYSKVAVQTEY